MPSLNHILDGRSESWEVARLKESMLGSDKKKDIELTSLYPRVVQHTLNFYAHLPRDVINFVRECLRVERLIPVIGRCIVV